ncbi:hypothetical protein GEMRC1_005635 [Eukaryota sp. GEM-RC1]
MAEPADFDARLAIERNSYEAQISTLKSKLSEISTMKKAAESALVSAQDEVSTLSKQNDSLTRAFSEQIEATNYQINLRRSKEQQFITLQQKYRDLLDSRHPPLPSTPTSSSKSSSCSTCASLRGKLAELKDSLKTMTENHEGRAKIRILKARIVDLQRPVKTFTEGGDEKKEEEVHKDDSVHDIPLSHSLMLAQKASQKWYQKFVELGHKYNELGTKAEETLNTKILEFEKSNSETTRKYEQKISKIQSHYESTVSSLRNELSQLRNTFSSRENDYLSKLAEFERLLVKSASQLNQLQREKNSAIQITEALENKECLECNEANEQLSRLHLQVIDLQQEIQSNANDNQSLSDELNRSLLSNESLTVRNQSLQDRLNDVMSTQKETEAEQSRRFSLMIEKNDHQIRAMRSYVDELKTNVLVHQCRGSFLRKRVRCLTKLLRKQRQKKLFSTVHNSLIKLADSGSEIVSMSFNNLQSNVDRKLNFIETKLSKNFKILSIFEFDELLGTLGHQSTFIRTLKSFFPGSSQDMLLQLETDPTNSSVIEEIRTELNQSSEELGSIRSDLIEAINQVNCLFDFGIFDETGLQAFSSSVFNLIDENQRLTQHNQFLESKILSSTRLLKNLDIENSKYKKALKIARNEIDKLKRRLRVLELTAESKNSKNRGEFSDVPQKFNLIRDTFHNEVSNQNNVISELESKIEFLVNSVETLESEKQLLAESSDHHVVELNHSIDCLNSTISELSQNNHDLHVDAHYLHDLLSQKDEEVNKLEIMIATSNNGTLLLNQYVEELKNQINHLQNVNHDFNCEAHFLHDVLSQKSEEVNRQESVLISLSEENSNLVQSVSDLQSDLIGSNQRVEELVDCLRTTEQNSLQMDEEIKEVEQVFSRQFQSLDNQLQMSQLDFYSEKVEIFNNFHVLYQDFLSSSDLNSLLCSHLLSLHDSDVVPRVQRAEMDENFHKMVELRGQSEELIVKVRELEMENSEQVGQLEVARAEIVDLEAQNSQLSVEVSRMSEEISRLSEEVSHLREQLSQSAQSDLIPLDDFDMLMTENDLLLGQLDDLILTVAISEKNSMGNVDFDCDSIGVIQNQNNDTETEVIRSEFEKLSRQLSELYQIEEMFTVPSSLSDLVALNESLSMNLHDSYSTFNNFKIILNNWFHHFSFIPSSLIDFFEQVYMVCHELTTIHEEFVSSQVNVIDLSHPDLLLPDSMQSPAEVAAINSKLSRILKKSSEYDIHIRRVDEQISHLKQDFTDACTSLLEIQAKSEYFESVLMDFHDQEPVFSLLLSELETKEQDLLSKHEKLSTLEAQLLSWQLHTNDKLDDTTNQLLSSESLRKQIDDLNYISPSTDAINTAVGLISLLRKTVSKMSDRSEELLYLRNALYDCDSQSEGQRTVVISKILDEVVAVKNEIRKWRKKLKSGKKESRDSL